MKNLKNVKKLLILIMTIGLIVMFSNLVYAAEEDPFVSLTVTNSEGNTAGNTAGNTESNTSNSLFTNINTTNTNTNVTNTNTNTSGTLTTINTTNNTANNTTNRSVSNTETLAKTGLTDSNGIVALIVIICAVSAIYSYKKINDYKRL